MYYIHSYKYTQTQKSDVFHTLKYVHTKTEGIHIAYTHIKAHKHRRHMYYIHSNKCTQTQKTDALNTLK